MAAGLGVVPAFGAVAAAVAADVGAQRVFEHVPDAPQADRVGAVGDFLPHDEVAVLEARALGHADEREALPPHLALTAHAHDLVECEGDLGDEDDVGSAGGTRVTRAYQLARWIDGSMHKRVRKRYAAERRFRLLGLGAGGFRGGRGLLRQRRRAGQQKGGAEPPSTAYEMMPLPHEEDFEEYEEGDLVRYFSDVNGGFEVASAGGDREGKVFRQMVSMRPITWGLAGAGVMDPTTVIGDPRWWGDYEVRTDVLLEQDGYVELLGRLSAQAHQKIAGYHQFHGGRKALQITALVPASRPISGEVVSVAKSALWSSATRRTRVRTDAAETCASTCSRRSWPPRSPTCSPPWPAGSRSGGAR